MATRTLWNSGHFLPSPRQKYLLQGGVSSLNQTFLTSLSPSLRDVMRGIIEATQNFRRAKKQKYGQKGITRSLTSDFLYKAGLPSAPGQVDEGFIQPGFESSPGGKFHSLFLALCSTASPSSRQIILPLYLARVCFTGTFYTYLCCTLLKRPWFCLVDNPPLGLTEKTVITIPDPPFL